MFRLYAIAFATAILVVSLVSSIWLARGAGQTLSLTQRSAFPYSAAPPNTCCVRKGDSRCLPENC